VSCVLCPVYCVLCPVYCVLCTVYCVLCATVYCVRFSHAALTSERQSGVDRLLFGEKEALLGFVHLDRCTVEVYDHGKSGEMTGMGILKLATADGMPVCSHTSSSTLYVLLSSMVGCVCVCVCVRMYMRARVCMHGGCGLTPHVNALQCTPPNSSFTAHTPQLHAHFSTALRSTHISSLTSDRPGSAQDLVLCAEGSGED
jgi:hypothetical protein